MSSETPETLTKPPFRNLTATKQLTLAFGGLYIARTTVTAKPLLIWETEKAYPRYYVPTTSLHPDIRAQLSGDSNRASNGHDKQVQLMQVDTAKGGSGEAVVERLSVGSKSTHWYRFTQGPLKDYIRFEKDDLG